MTATEARPIRPRAIPSSHVDGELPHLFMSGDLLLSHLDAIGSALFPEGEAFFVRSVRHFRDDITDPVPFSCPHASTPYRSALRPERGAAPVIRLPLPSRGRG